MLRGAGLKEVPGEVWVTGPGLAKLDLSENPQVRVSAMQGGDVGLGG